MKSPDLMALFYSLFMTYFLIFCLAAVTEFNLEQCQYKVFVSNLSGLFNVSKINYTYMITVYTQYVFASISVFVYKKNFNSFLRFLIAFSISLISLNFKIFSCNRKYITISHLSKVLGKFVSSLMKTCIIWLSIINFVLVVVANPSIKNPGPVKEKVSDLKVFYQNVQGLIPFGFLSDPNPKLNVTKVTELQAHIYESLPDIVILNETWLKPSISDSEIFNSDMYTIQCREDRSNISHERDPLNPKKFRKYGGGVLIATRSDLDVTIIPIKTKCSAEIASIQLNFQDGQKLVVCTLYRVGNLGIDHFEKVEKYLQTIRKRRGITQFIVVGDLNLNKIDWNSPDECKDNVESSFYKLFNDLDLTQIINKPTHVKGNILDLVLTSSLNNIINSSVAEQNFVCNSDHFAITFEIKAKVKRINKNACYIYNYKNVNWESLNLEFSKVNWLSILSGTSIDTKWSQFKSKFFEIVDKHIPKVKVKGSFQPPWFDSDVFVKCREKNRLHAKYKETNDASWYLKFSNCRNELKKLCKQKMRDNFTTESDSSTITKKFWSYVKSNNNSHRIPSSVSYNGVHKTETTDQANLFNNFFKDQFSEQSVYDIEINSSAFSSSKYNISFDTLDISLILKDINPNKAHGPDNIPGRILKYCSPTLAYPLKILFESSYNTGCLPDEWKLANVVPIFKKGSKNDVENYRPISLTSIVMKQFEKIVRKKLMELTSPFITEHQHGFLPFKSCQTQLVSFVDSLHQSLNTGCRTDIVYFDFAKAFDSVNHDLLLHKLKNQFNIDGPLLRFIKSYLQNRKQRVVIGNCFSSLCDVFSGVPQGSIVGPLLFVLFINDIVNNISPGSSIALYADDTKLWREINSILDNRSLQADITTLHEWSVMNKMNFHPDKCKILPATRENNFSVDNDENFKYYLGNSLIKYTLEEKDLGVYITPRVSFTSHCEKIYKKSKF